MPKCLKCNGTGYVVKHKECTHNTHDAYINGCNDPVKCRACHGFGTTGIEQVKAILLEIKITTTDTKIHILAKQALKEWENK
jgi:hypothetical protein